MATKRKLAFFLGSLAVFLGLVALLFYLFQPKAKKGNLLRQVSFSKLPISLCQDQKAIEKAIETSISILEARRDEGFSVLGKRIKRKSLLNSLDALERRLKAGLGLKKALAGLFELYEVQKDGESARLLVTGYYQPLLKGSLEKGTDYHEPVLGVPGDLIQVRLRDFDKALPAKTLFGRIKKKRLVPYYSRREIDERMEKRLQSLPVLCWLKDPVDLLELQIQGSGIIMIGNRRRFIHYAASNGRPYVSLGRLLLKRGILPIERLDWPSIKAWARENPLLFKRLLSRNERYVFFRWEKTGPIGCYGKVLVPGVSVALDKKIFPPALPLIVRLSLPETDGVVRWLKKKKGGVTESLFVMNHDTGSAIKGPFRMDLYAGTGSAAGELAGRMKQRARMYVLVPKEK